MTHDELKALANSLIGGSSCNPIAVRLAEGYLALSAQLDAKEHAELIADAEIERAKALDERNAMLSARLEEALSFIGRMAMVFKS